MWCGRKIDGKGRARKHTPPILARITMRINWALDILLPPKFQIEQTMKELQSILKWAILIIGGVGVLILLLTITNEAYLSPLSMIDPKLAADFGSFVGGFVGTIFSLTGTLVVAYTFEKQFRQTNQMFEEQNKLNRKSEALNIFFRRIELHHSILEKVEVPNKKGELIKGYRAFTLLMDQYHDLCSIFANGNPNLPAKLRELWEDSEESYQLFFALVYAVFYDSFGWSNIVFPSLKDVKDDKSVGILANTIRDTLVEYRRKHEEEKEEEDPLNRSVVDMAHNIGFLLPYFNNLYDTLEFIRKNESFSCKERKEFVKTMCSFLSKDEIYFLHEYILSNVGVSLGQNWDVYVNDYGLFEYYSEYKKDIKTARRALNRES